MVTAASGQAYGAARNAVAIADWQAIQGTLETPESKIILDLLKVVGKNIPTWWLHGHFSW